LTHVAQWWDFGSYRDKVFLAPFFTTMTPLEFQLQLKQCFGVVTTVRRQNLAPFLARPTFFHT
jgi:hypothetical protein